MKKIILKISAFMLCAVMVFSLCGCDEEVVIDASENLEGMSKTLAAGKVAENANFVMEWNAEMKCVTFTDKKSGAKWSTSPADYIDMANKPARARNFLESPMIIEYFNTELGEADTIRGFTDCVRDGNIGIEKNGNTLTVGYYFDETNIYVPVDYTIEDDHFSISVDTNNIVEGENPVYSIKLTPYVCSVKTGTADSYLFYPSGCGTIVDTSNPKLIATEGLSTAVYGPDAARKIKEKLTNEKNVYIPVYGVKIGNNALMSVISSGEESASLILNGNEEITGYSSVYPEFYIRGYDYNTIKGNLTYDETSIYAKEPLRDSVLKMDYYSLSGEEANYNGMAKRYQKVLFGNNDATDIKEDAFSLKIAGGLMQQKDFLGYPYETLLALTTYSDVQAMLDELKDTGVKPNVQMYGFGETGLDVGEVAGGFVLGDEFGSKKEIKSLLENCKNDGIDAFMDFNMTTYDESGGGYTSLFDTAKTANRQAAYQYYLSKSVQVPEEKLYDRFRLLKRDCVISAAEKLLGKLDKYGITGVSFESLSNTAYSDYSSDKYYMKKGFGQMVKDIVASYKDKGYAFAANGANAYAATVADCIFEAPLNSSEYEAFAYDVPFYQMVFKGKVEMTSESVNVGEALQKKELQALETGSSMLFTVYDEYKSELSFSPFRNLYGGVYNSNKENIKKVAADYKDFYDSVSGKTIVKHEVLANGVRSTTFSNGVRIFVNYSDKDYTCEAGTVQAMNCLIVK